MSLRLFDDTVLALTAYRSWLNTQPLTHNTRLAYLLAVTNYCTYLANCPEQEKGGQHLTNENSRDWAVRDYKLYLKTVRLARPSSVNLALAGLDHFYAFVGLGRTKVHREVLPQLSPRALEPSQQKSFLRAVEGSPSKRDQALALLLFYTALRIGECAALKVEDVNAGLRKGQVIVRNGKGATYREVPLNSQVRQALRVWLVERETKYQSGEQTAFFLNLKGQPLSIRAIDLSIRAFGKTAGLSLSAHVLRHTCLTNLVRAGNDLVLVAEIAGHKRLETTRRYSLPSRQDREAAMEFLEVNY
jgi:site-specific recombinase XerD